MSNQLLIPPEVDTEKQPDQNQPLLWSNVEAEGSFWQSLLQNLRDAIAPQKLPPLQLQSKPIPVEDPFHEDSIWASLRDDFRDLLFPKKLPPLQLESHEIPVPDPLARPRDRKSTLISLGVHAVLLAGIVALLLWHPKRPVVAQVAPPPNFNITPFMPFTKAAEASGGGGGGGDHDVLQAAKGKLPKISKTQFVPPDEIIRNPKPKLAVDPSVVMPQNIKLPDNTMPNLGDPMTAVRGPLSNGTGSNGGIGSGKSGGVGSGSGAGVGPGEGGGYGGGLYHVGGGVTPPRLIYQVDAEFSDEARKAKYQGQCVVQVIVDTNGIPRNPRVVRALGMGLDQKAIDAVKQYRFKPAMLGGRPVPVEIDVLVDFHIY